MATEGAGREATKEEMRGIDAWMRRYSRWRERRLTHMAELPLSSLALQNLFLCLCILFDGVFLPWIVVLVAGGFSYALLGLLLLPSLVAEGLVYRRIKAREVRPARHG